MTLTAYYNEIEPNAAAWLRTLISEGHIAPGDVDTRSIVDVRSSDLVGYRQVHFFAGIGGWSLALRLAGYGDGDAVWTGSCPCQPFSLAGRRSGFDDARHLWPEFRRLIAERRPATIFGEQVASAADWLRLVRGDLEALEYAVGAMPIEAASAGADHLRDRFWFVADHEYAGEGRRGIQRPGEGAQAIGERPPNQSSGPSDDFAMADADQPQRWIGDEQPAGQQPEQQPNPSARVGGNMAHTMRDRARSGSTASDRSEETSFGIDGCVPRAGAPARFDGEIEWVIGADGKARRVKSGVRLLAHGIPNRVGLLRGFGNAIDPRPAATFIKAAVAAAR